MFPDLKGRRAILVGTSPLQDAAEAAFIEAGAAVRSVDDPATILDDDVDVLVTLPRPLVACALSDVSRDAGLAAFGTIVDPVVAAARTAIVGMKQRGWGRVINVVWGQAVGAMRNVSLDSSAAAAVNQFSRAVGIEYARTGITVNVIALGWFPEIGLENVEALKRYIPRRRLGNAEDLGALLIYLASDQASYVTAQTHLLDGGLRARG